MYVQQWDIIIHMHCISCQWGGGREQNNGCLHSLVSWVLSSGLLVTRNFNGCLKSIYINDQSVLYKLFAKHNSCQYHGGERPTFGCSPVRDIPISFPKAASALQWTIGSRSPNLTVDFSFRTVQKNSILFYVDLLSVKEGGSGYDYGILEVCWNF